jgi:hypothetical protein
MKTLLAERLLAEIMEWDSEKVSYERPRIHAISQIKYDEYQQYTPGVRYIQSLVRWLNQFDTIKQRDMIYDFISKNLVFISNSEVVHLINIAFPDYIRKILIDRAAKEIGIKEYMINQIIRNQQYWIIMRETLFFGLSDGARIDYFRRINGSISNEQITPTYQPNEEKIRDMLEHLNKDLRNVGINSEEKHLYFKTLFLLDDFTASGKSYIRENALGNYSGKIPKLLAELNDTTKALSKLVNGDDYEIHILFYIATSKAINYIKDQVNRWKTENDKHFVFSVNAILTLETDCKNLIYSNNELESLLSKYFDAEIINSHYQKGKTDKPYLGFDECGLSLALHHNTPNNSLPILWSEQDRSIIGLFPRINRHKDEWLSESI